MRHTAAPSLCCAAALFLAASLPAASLAQPDTPDPIAKSLRDRCASAAVLIETFDADNKLIGPAAGFLVEPNLLITDRHCIEGASRAALNLGPDGQLPITGIIADGHDLDIVILTVPKLPDTIHPLHWAAKPAGIGDKVYLILRGSDGDLSVDAGVVSSIGSSTKGPEVETNIAATLGCSGSPIVNADGDVAIAVNSLTGGPEKHTAAGGAPPAAIQALKTAGAQPLADWWQPQETPGGPAVRRAIEEGKDMSIAGNNEGASQRFRDAVNLDPTNGAARRYLIRALAAAGHKDDARKAAHDWTEHSPQDPDAWMSAAELLHRQLDYKAAIEAYEKSIQLKPTAAAYFWKANALAVLKDNASAVEALRQCVSLNPTDVRAYIDLGYSLEHLNDYLGAADAFSKAVSLSPNDPSIYDYLAHMYYQQGKYDEAEDAADRYLKHGGDAFLAQCRLGAIAYRRNQFDKAATAYSTALDLHPNDSEIMYWLADSYLRTGDKDHARPLIDRLSKLSPYRANRLRLELDPEPSK